VFDALGRRVIEKVFRAPQYVAGTDMAGNALYQNGMDGGARRTPPLNLILSSNAPRLAMGRQDTETSLRCLENGLRALGADFQIVWDARRGSSSQNWPSHSNLAE
jgi:hypothetical protein